MSTLPIPLSPTFSFLLSPLLLLFFPAITRNWFESCSSNPLLFMLFSLSSLSFSASPSPYTWELSALSSQRREIGSPGVGEARSLDTGAGRAIVTQPLNK